MPNKTKKIDKTIISIIDYDKTHLQEKETKKVEECLPFKDKSTITWINVDGIHDKDILKKIGKYFNLHLLTLEDIVTTEQRPKIEDFGEYIFIVLKMLYCGENDTKINAEQVSLILGPNYVISFQEKKGDVFNPIRERIRNTQGRIREMKADYLAYTLMDAIVNNYTMVLEKVGEEIGHMEERVVINSKPTTLQAIHKLKRKMLFFRKSIWPLREILNELERGESTLINKTTVTYLRDVHDHTIQIIDTIETFQDMLLGMVDIYLSTISNKTNEVMKALTIIATIFIPLTFITGVYGMNFRYMPEIDWRWGYFFAWFVMGTIAVIMMFYFRKKKWL
ncbi:MAG: magnesium/cobalt transporter CorA [Candidatus Methanofastidiosia archaeon]